MRVGTGAISKFRYGSYFPELKVIAMDYETEPNNEIFERSKVVNDDFKLSNESFCAESLSEMGEWSLCGNYNVHERAYSPYSFATVRYVSRHEGIEDNACE